MLKEEFNKLVDAYQVEESERTLNAMKVFLKRHMIYFRKYYDNTEGKSPSVLSNSQDKGKFLDFSESTQYKIPSLLKVENEGGETIYVSLNDFTFA